MYKHVLTSKIESTLKKRPSAKRKRQMEKLLQCNSNETRWEYLEGCVTVLNTGTVNVCLLNNTLFNGAKPPQ